MQYILSLVCLHSVDVHITLALLSTMSYRTNSARNQKRRNFGKGCVISNENVPMRKLRFFLSPLRYFQIRTETSFASVASNFSTSFYTQSAFLYFRNARIVTKMSLISGKKRVKMILLRCCDGRIVCAMQ